jgi:hypothetical protein
MLFSLLYRSTILREPFESDRTVLDKRSMRFTGEQVIMHSQMETPRSALESELERAEAELADALTRHALHNDRCSEIGAALESARARGDAQAASDRAAQLDVAEARRARAMALAQTASQHLNELRRRLRDG